MEGQIEYFIIALSSLLILAGLFGTIFPILPGSPLVFLGVLIFAWYGRFSEIAVVTIIAFLAFTFAGVVIDFAGSAWGAKKFGASWWGVLGAFVGLILGVIFLGPLGIIIGPLLGVILLELLSGKQLKAALRAGSGTLIAYLISTIYNLTLSLVMLGLFIWSLIK